MTIEYTRHDAEDLVSGRTRRRFTQPLDSEMTALAGLLDDPGQKVACPRCGNSLTYTENVHGRAATCEHCSIMTAERSL